ncbi:E3 ubiquitin- ligase UBR5 [Brachionus plicatilis]|uniref:E3 ubiquitin-ligase UBR5 n=1 Tax=Brachionus plicatilis TaxID=10195 RepID=A0A3M7QJW3_BRAPC|nr:E3 ubiquitin- ligase UBR5 [Brachionus plicatilis]
MSLLDINSSGGGGAGAQNADVPNENDSSSSSSSSSSSTAPASATANVTASQAAHAGQSIGMFDEENFRLIRRFGNSIIGTRSSEERDVTSRKTSSYRLRDNRWYESYRDDLFNRSESEEKAKKSEQSAGVKESGGESVITFGDNIQYWIEKRGDTPQFVRIASLYSELVAVCKEGKLHQWKWSSDIPYSVESEDKKIVYHPKSGPLGLVNERIVGLSSSLIRGCCWTESGKVACWFDDSVHLTNLTCKYETECTAFTTDRNLSANEKIIEMSTSNLFTVYRTSLGSSVCGFYFVFFFTYGGVPDLRINLLEKKKFNREIYLYEGLLLKLDSYHYAVSLQVGHKSIADQESFNMFHSLAKSNILVTNKSGGEVWSINCCKIRIDRILIETTLNNLKRLIVNENN